MGGGKVKVDADYVRKSIEYPADDVVEGFGPVSKMNSFRNKLSPEDIINVDAFLKKLNDPSSVAGGTVDTGLRADGE